MNNEELLMELRTISKILTLGFADSIERELSKVATTNERKKMWVLMDGENQIKNIAEKISVSARTVHYFVSDAIKAGLAISIWGKPPRRAINYVPPKWIELLPKIEEKGEIKEVSESGQ